MARRAKPKKWLPHIVEALHAYAGVYSAESIALEFNTRFGTSFTETAIHVKLNRCGIEARVAAGDMCLADVAAELGITKRMIDGWRTSHDAKLYGKGRYRYMPEEAVERLRAYFTPPSIATVTTTEAARLLGLKHSMIPHRIKKGQLESFPYINGLRISLRSIEKYAKINLPGHVLRLMELERSLAKVSRPSPQQRASLAALQSYRPDFQRSAIAQLQDYLTPARARQGALCHS